MFFVIDRTTKARMGCYQTLKRARARADKLDNIYGGYKYIVVDINGKQYY